MPTTQHSENNIEQNPPSERSSGLQCPNASSQLSSPRAAPKSTVDGLTYFLPERTGGFSPQSTMFDQLPLETLLDPFHAHRPRRKPPFVSRHPCPHPEKEQHARLVSFRVATSETSPMAVRRGIQPQKHCIIVFAVYAAHSFKQS